MKIFDGNFWILVGLLAVLALVAFARGGTPLVFDAMSGGTRQFLRFVLVLYVSFLVAGLVEGLLPRAWVSQALGERSGWRGLALASAVGLVTPAGPYVSMPIAAGMLRSGASPATVVAFVSAWALLAIHRLIAWEIPLLGLRFALTRWLLSLAAPILLGALARLYWRAAA